jgi:hypothetical protein
MRWLVPDMTGGHFRREALFDSFLTADALADFFLADFFFAATRPGLDEVALDFVAVFFVPRPKISSQLSE